MSDESKVTELPLCLASVNIILRSSAETKQYTVPSAQFLVELVPNVELEIFELTTTSFEAAELAIEPDEVEIIYHKRLLEIQQ